MGVTIALSTASIVESEKVISWEQINDIQSLIDIPIQIFKDSGEIPYLESIAEISNVYGVTSTCFSILEALVYKSYANFVGEIKVTVSTYCEEYQFRGKYNIMGDKEGEYTSSYKPIQKSDFLLKVPEDNKTTIKYKIYEDGMFQTGEITDFMW
uniref:hypothetical protein n=1 Tax=Clostridium sp. NkU-1 TaxID=1095009 RepID=UPI0006D15D99